jgi:O-succinylbenzoic acid--CoA ligase
VFPSTVEAILLSHPDVQDCIVKGEKNSILGQLVVAEVSLRQPSDDIVPELRKLCKALLPNYCVPQKFSVVNELRFSLSGKKMRG